MLAAFEDYQVASLKEGVLVKLRSHQGQVPEKPSSCRGITPQVSYIKDIMLDHIKFKVYFILCIMFKNKEFPIQASSQGSSSFKVSSRGYQHLLHIQGKCYHLHSKKVTSNLGANIGRNRNKERLTSFSPTFMNLNDF